MRERVFPRKETGAKEDPPVGMPEKKDEDRDKRVEYDLFYPELNPESNQILYKRIQRTIPWNHKEREEARDLE